MGHISYGLHAIVAVARGGAGLHRPGIALLLVAIVLDLIKRGDAMGTWQESHFSWRHAHRVFWAGGLYVLTIAAVVPVRADPGHGWPGLLISLWFLYRVVRGWLALNEQPADAS